MQPESSMDPGEISIQKLKPLLSVSVSPMVNVSTVLTCLGFSVLFLNQVDKTHLCEGRGVVGTASKSIFCYCAQVDDENKR